MPSYRVMFARFPYGGTEYYKCTDWLVKTVVEAKQDRHISEVLHMSVNDTPITMGRNRVLKECLKRDVDILLMVDSDMHPDLYLGQRGVKPFWRSSLDWLLNHQGPCCIAAPYCGPPPHENIYVFRWGRRQSEHPNVDLVIDQYCREEAAMRMGMEEVCALPTGLFMMDMRALKSIRPPWFEYEWEDPPFNTAKATTEDVFFTRNLSIAGVKQYCNWDAWAGHMKSKCVGKPVLLSCDSVREEFKEALGRANPSKECLIDVPRGGLPGNYAAAREDPVDRTNRAMAKAFNGADQVKQEGSPGNV